MTTTPQRCPCGSGKPLGRCCSQKQLAQRKFRLIATCALCVLVAVGLVALTFSMAPEKKAPANAAVVTPILSGAAGLPQDSSIPATANPRIPNPRPWQYDPVANKHFDPSPGHFHWHTGPPPPEDQRTGSAPTTTTTTPFSTSTTVTPPR